MGGGTRNDTRRTHRDSRIIPAWAGNTGWVCDYTKTRSDHPRVGGKHGITPIPGERSPGSSPRGRGTRMRSFLPRHQRRIIPAWAGNTDREFDASIGGADHPRVGGEHEKGSPVVYASTGSSPRGRGTLVVGCYGHAFSPDHPRVGGEHELTKSVKRHGVRIIPAWAGNTTEMHDKGMLISDHPRVGGEHFPLAAAAIAWLGSSPRGRGTQPMSRPIGSVSRIIPAWAGNTSVQR